MVCHRILRTNVLITYFKSPEFNYSLYLPTFLYSSLFFSFLLSPFLPFYYLFQKLTCNLQCVTHCSKREIWVQSLGWEDPLQKWMATHSSILAWEIQWIYEPGVLYSVGSQRLIWDWMTNTFSFFHLDLLAYIVIKRLSVLPYVFSYIFSPVKHLFPYFGLSLLNLFSTYAFEFSLVELSLHILDTKPLPVICITNDFLLVCSLLFHFLQEFFWWTKHLNFNKLKS